MGCFSYICKECDNPILSDSFSGQEVKLFLLKDGKVIETLEGQYDSYGRVFDNKMESTDWKMDWSDVCDLIWDQNKGNGIAGIHSKCFKNVPTTQSKDDPNQGWGD